MQSVRTANAYSSGSFHGQGSNIRNMPPTGTYTSPVHRQNIGSDAVRSDSTRSTATLSNNLSELDSLLQELSSAQFAVEMDRRSTDQGLNSLAKSSVIRTSDGPGQPSNTLTQRAGSITVASSATKELDDLMASLNTMDNTEPVLTPAQKPGSLADPVGSVDSLLHRSSGVAPAPLSQPREMHSVPAIAHTKDTSQMAVTHDSGGSPLPSNGSQTSAVNLGALLDDLDRNMTQYGVTTVPKGHCSACAKPIVGQVVMALGRLWHPEHFTCVHCKEPLGTQNFFERDAVPYCERDYHLMFSPQCASCGGPILDKCMTALDQTWHPEHFCCFICGVELGDEIGFHEHDGHPYCREDYFEHFAPRCGGCGRPIVENFISALNRQWHPPCFVCNECRVPFGTGTFFEHNGMPYCETHFHAQRGSLCAGCHKPVTGRCITAMYRKYHPEHFVCTYCQRQLNKGTFKEEKDMPYCHPCFVRLFS